MRYTHGFRVLHKRKNIGIVSLTITAILMVVVAVLGFTVLDARQFFGGFALSFMRVMAAYVVSLFLAILLSLLLMADKRIEAVLLPILDVLQSFPSIALFPVLLLWFGKTSLVTVLILVVAMVWPLLFTTLAAQKQIREDLLDASRAFGATGLKFYWYVLFPLLFSSLVTGSIVAWGEAWETIIAAEIIIAIPGVGTYLAESGKGNSSVLGIGILLLLIMLFVLNKYIWLPLLNFATRYQND